MSDQANPNTVEQQQARRRLVRLLDALPVFSGFCSADGHLLQTRPATQEAFLWALPAFNYSHDSITQIVEACERAARGERVQLERLYNPLGLPGQAGADAAPTPPDDAELRRCLLTLDPIEADDGFVEELGVTVIDCDANGLGVRDSQAATRLAVANRRIASLLSLSQAVIETLSRSGDRRRDTRDAISARLSVLARAIDPLSDPDAQSLALDRLVALAVEDEAHAVAAARFAVDVVPCNVPMEYVPLMLLMLSELAANAREHGAWRPAPGDAGRVTLHGEVLDTHAGRSLRLHWIEDGGPEVATALHTGFGVSLGRKLFPQLTGGSASMLDTAEGVSWTLELPLATNGDDDPDEGFGGFDGGFDGGGGGGGGGVRVAVA